MDGKCARCGISVKRRSTAFRCTKVYDAVGAALLDDYPSIVSYACISVAWFVRYIEGGADGYFGEAFFGRAIGQALAYNFPSDGKQVLAYLRIVAFAELGEEFCILTWAMHGPQYELVSTVPSL